MTVPTQQQIAQMGPMPRPLRERLRDRGSLTLLGVCWGTFCLIALLVASTT